MSNVRRSKIHRQSRRRQAARFEASEVALARKIAVILHRMWVDGSTYRGNETQPIATQV
jgi:hypothetical protein